MELEEINKTLKTTNIKGKEYVEVNERVKAFRKLYPEGQILTKLIKDEDGKCIFEAIISNGEKLIATGTAYEKENSTFINKTSYIENCETSAVGRALGFAGIGIDTSIASKEEVENAIENQPKQINSTKASAIKELIKRKGANLEEILKYYKIATIEQLDEQQYVQLYENLNKREDIA